MYLKKKKPHFVESKLFPVQKEQFVKQLKGGSFGIMYYKQRHG